MHFLWILLWNTYDLDLVAPVSCDAWGGYHSPAGSVCGQHLDVASPLVGPVLLFVASLFLAILSASYLWESTKGFGLPGNWRGDVLHGLTISGAFYKLRWILGVGLIVVWFPSLWWSHFILFLVFYKGIFSQKHPVSLEHHDTRTPIWLKSNVSAFRYPSLTLIRINCVR